MTDPERSEEAVSGQKDDSSAPFLHRPIAVVTLVSGVVGTLTAVIGLILSTYSGGDSTTQPVGTTEQSRLAKSQAIENCTLAHGLSSPIQKDVGVSGGVLFRQCSWPPVPGADPDGYAEIAVSSRAGPGESEAEGLTVADYVRSSCRDIELIYLFDSQGTFVPEEPLLLSKGEIRRIEGGSIWLSQDKNEANTFSPGRDESIVMSNGRHMLDTARCV